MIPATKLVSSRKPLCFKLDEAVWTMSERSWKHEGPTFSFSMPALWFGKKDKKTVLYAGTVSSDWLGMETHHFPQVERYITTLDKTVTLPPGMVQNHEVAPFLSTPYARVGLFVEDQVIYTLDPQPYQDLVAMGAMLTTLAAQVSGAILPPPPPGFGNWYMRD